MTEPNAMPAFVLVTPVRNEAANIARTIESVLAQTILPRAWAIVNDGSTDATGDIVRAYSERYPFIRLLEKDGDARRNFGSKIRAFAAGYTSLWNVPYDFIGNLDGDVSFDPNYFETLLIEFQRDPKLGLTGGFILEQVKGEFVRRKVSLQSVAGAVQLFRRTCFEQIGGLPVSERGGEDSIAEITARMHGWRVHTLPNLLVKHHGRVLSGGKNICLSRFNKGIVNYQLGYHPLFHSLLSVQRMTVSPRVIGGMLILAGYMWAAVRRRTRTVSKEFVAYLRHEQCERIKSSVLRRGTPQLAGPQ